MVKKNKDIIDLSFEDGLAELERLVNRLEERDIGLEESLNTFERGHALQLHLSAILKAAELRIEKITTQSEIAANVVEKNSEKSKKSDITSNDELPF